MEAEIQRGYDSSSSSSSSSSSIFSVFLCVVGEREGLNRGKRKVRNLKAEAKCVKALWMARGENPVVWVPWKLQQQQPKTQRQHMHKTIHNHNVNLSLFCHVRV
ncbi:hypothetical protein SDJN02_10393, partial [Cucurbita argyrosperma subsp. argyrosperma]